MHTQSKPEKQHTHLDSNKSYRAKLIWRKEGYSNVPLKHYFITPNDTHCFFYDDIDKTQCRGCFPLQWFSDFSEINRGKVTYMIEETNHEEPLDLFTWEQLSLFKE